MNESNSMDAYFESFMSQNAEEHRLMSMKDVRLIRIKLGKSHRKESDWELIKGILLSHNLIVIEPAAEDPRLPVKDHILCEDGLMVAFTNIEDCSEHILTLNRETGTPNRLFKLGSMPFTEAVAIADKHKMDLYIDLQAKSNAVCMAYYSGTKEIKAMKIGA